LERGILPLQGKRPAARVNRRARRPLLGMPSRHHQRGRDIMNKLLTTIAAVVFAASAGIAGAQAPAKGGDMKAAPGSPAAGTQTVPSPAASPEAGPKKGSPTADVTAPKK